MKRPNILLITSDQQRADCFGFENRHVSTPHLDRMAKEGTRFSACITPNLVCQPSRASILTGLLPLTHGVWDNGVDLDPQVGGRGFAGTLASGGYETAYFGKAHFATKATFQPTGTPECMRSFAKFGRDWRGPYMGFRHVELIVLGHINNPMPLERPPVGHYERWLLSRDDEERMLALCTASAGPDTEGAAQTWHSALPVAWHSSSWLGDRTTDWLRTRDRSKPFCAWISFPDPHQPFDCPAPWSRLHDPKDVPLPSTHGEDPAAVRPWWYKATLEGTPALADPQFRALRAKVSRMPKQTDRQLAQMTANYYGMISLVDHNVGRILGALQDLGLEEDTLVVFTTDHGDMMGAHGLMEKGHLLHYEEALRVPLLIRHPGRPAARNTNLTSVCDIARTLATLAGVPWDEPDDGRCFAHAVGATGAAPTREYVSAETTLADGQAGGHGDPFYAEHWSYPRDSLNASIRTARARYVFRSHDEDELFDLTTDPSEVTNLADRPDRQAQRQLLRDLLAGELADAFPSMAERLRHPAGHAG